jgi:hypothetical protein
MDKQTCPQPLGQPPADRSLPTSPQPQLLSPGSSRPQKNCHPCVRTKTSPMFPLAQSPRGRGRGRVRGRRRVRPRDAPHPVPLPQAGEGTRIAGRLASSRRRRVGLPPASPDDGLPPSLAWRRAASQRRLTTGCLPASPGVELPPSVACRRLPPASPCLQRLGHLGSCVRRWRRVRGMTAPHGPLAPRSAAGRGTG